MEQYGAAVLECSWARITETPWPKIGGKCERLLPSLVAVKTINYGRPWRLNCAKALDAAVYICGHPEWAEEVLSHFLYGQSFLDINSSILKRYTASKNEADVKKAKEAWVARSEKEYADSRADDGETDISIFGRVVMQTTECPSADLGGYWWIQKSTLRRHRRCE